MAGLDLIFQFFAFKISKMKNIITSKMLILKKNTIKTHRNLFNKIILNQKLQINCETHIDAEI